MSRPLDFVPTPKLVPVADCWKTIGVRGDASCAELKKHIHCRNCPVYGVAASALLDAAPPADYLEHWTRQVAQPSAPAPSDKHCVLIFRVDTEWLAVSASVVKEIVGRRNIHSLPHRRDGTVLGLANVRGELLVCFSLRHVLNIEPCGGHRHENQRRAEERLVVLQRDGGPLVCPVDEVFGMQHFRAHERTPTPATVDKAAGTYTRAMLRWQMKSVGLIDDELLFNAMSGRLA